jgi:hypothetical protein
MKRIISFHPELVEKLGNINTVLIFQQLSYWQDKMEDRWFYKTVEDLKQETTLGEKPQRVAIQKLFQLGWIDYKIKKVGNKPIRHFKVLVNINLTIRSNTLVNSKIAETIESEEVEETSITKEETKNKTTDALRSVIFDYEDQQGKASKIKTFDLEKILSEMSKTPGTWKDHIASFIIYKKINITSDLELKKLIKRYVRVARELESYSRERVQEAMIKLITHAEHCKKNNIHNFSDKWVLETVIKTLQK